MAGNPTFEVLDSYREWLSTQMPTMIQQRVANPVPVYYSHPGDRHIGNAAVWFGDIRDEYEVHSLRANVRRRQVLVEVDVVIEVILQGATTGTRQLQREADEFAHSIRRIIDLDIATDEHLHREDVVDVAKVLSTTYARGMTADGAGCRITMRVAFECRFID
jgi:hypothetical protein